MTSNRDITTILVSTETRDELKQYGRKSQTYDDIILELLKISKEIDEKANQEKLSK